MRYRTQDPKYDIEVTTDGAQLVNSISGKPIPLDEPIFIFRAQDRKALPHLSSYKNDCANGQHAAVVSCRIGEFEQFAASHPERMKEPDSRPTSIVVMDEHTECPPQAVIDVIRMTNIMGNRPKE